MTDKRRHVTLLPARLQTETNQKFFASTVDQLFQPGSSEQVSGYIGEKPIYYDPTKDFYLPEPTAARAAYQLTPAMVSRDANGATTHLSFHDDFINYLKNANALTADQNRLLADRSYAWAPPIDIDKLLNFQQYFWFGDNPERIPYLTLKAASATYTADGVASTYAMPERLSAIDPTLETPLAFVDGLPVEISYTDDSVSLVLRPFIGSVITVYRYGDLRRTMEGQTTFDVSPFLVDDVAVTLVTSNMRVKLQDGFAAFSGWDLLPFDVIKLRAPYLCRDTVNVPWDVSTLRQHNSFLIEGVGSSIQLVGVPSEPSDFADQLYTVIDRRSADLNPWSRANFWIHRDSFAWSGFTDPERRGRRPIVEFKPNIELHNYGTTRKRDITAVLTGNPILMGNEPPPDLYDSPVNAKDVPGWRELDLSKAGGQRIGRVFVDNGYRLRAGDRFLIRENANPELRNRVVEVKQAKQTITNADGSTSAVDVLVLIILDAPNPGDIVRKVVQGWLPYDEDGHDTRTWDFSEKPIEYVFDGDAWVVAQPADPHKDPLFKLYTEARIAHASLPKSTFTGNRLFGFAEGTGTVDPIIKRALRYATASSESAQAEIVFENDMVTRRSKSAGVEVPGLAYYRVFGATAADDVYENGWFETDDVSRQALSASLVFTTPANLLSNPDMEQVEFTDRSQYFEHFTALLRRQTGFVGSAYQRNNWRDTARLPNAGFEGAALWQAFTDYAVNDVVKNSIHHYRCTVAHRSTASFNPANWLRRPIVPVAQPRSAALKAMLLTVDRRFDYLDAARFADTEYQRYRNKFFHQIDEVSRTGQRLDGDPDDLWVETILTFLRTAKTPDFAFALSSMAGGTYYISPTAASMGMLQVAMPGYEIDDTYNPPLVILRGHDGSRTPVEVGLRSRIMLALEMRIWRNINATFKTEEKPFFDFNDYIASRANGGGKGRETTRGDITPCDDDPTPYESDNPFYLPVEIAQILTPIFIAWAQTNNYDFRSHDDYVASNPFTWNYRDVLDIDGRACAGNWRAIYRWFFDTDRPHAAPWQMLGFFDQPSWWEETYGAAPYTSGNIPLWEDLRDGVVRAGPRAGIDDRFKRPDLLSILPVDEEGRLRDPMASGVVPRAPSLEQAQRPWAIGDHGPIENLWINSASFPFARAMLGYLIRPFEWTEIQWNTRDYTRLPTGQWFNRDTHDRPRSKLLSVHGEINAAGTRTAITGMQQWIADRMTSRAQKPTALGDALRGLGVRLAHKMAGFTQANNLRVFADNFGILPSEDVEVVLHTSPPLREAVYSGVIVEWTGSGWSVVGYDTSKDGFCVKPGNPASPKQQISLGEDPPVYEWRPNRNYPMNTLVDYRGTIYRAVRAHTSAVVFEEEFWSTASVVNSRLPKVYVYTKPENFYSFVPYGTVFTTIQEVAEFLWDWGAAQEADGFVFDGVDPVTGDIQNWELMIRQFLEWVQMDWQPGNFLALSPGASSLKFVTAHGTVFNIEDTVNGIYGLIDRTGRPIPRKNTFVTRLDEETKIICTSENLFCARLRVGEIEHVMMLSNLTLFNDVIYRPLFSLRQPRLRMIGLRTREWHGRLDAPGYIVNGNDLLPNLDRSAENLRTMFEIEGSEDRVLRDHARHVIGYQPRPYLNNLLISETQQIEFYQGMIQQKGAPGVFEKLTRSRIVDEHTDLAFLEEWGFQIGRYGATDVRKTLSFRIDQTDLRGAPQFVSFGKDDPHDAILALDKGDGRWVKEPADIAKVFPETMPPAPLKGAGSPQTNKVVPALPTAGPVRLDEIDVSAFDPSYLQQLFTEAQIDNPIRVGWTLWLYDSRSSKRGWDVLRAYQVGADDCDVLSIDTQDEDPTIRDGAVRVNFKRPHGLTVRDNGLYLVIEGTTGSNPDFQGFQKIVSVTSASSVIIDGYLSPGVDVGGSIPAVKAYVLRSQRFSNVIERNEFYSIYPMVKGQFCYVDKN